MVVATDRDMPLVEKLAADVPGVVPIEADVADTEAVNATAAETVRRWGGLDIWVNNAGVYPSSGPVLDSRDDQFDHVMTVNVRGTLAGARAAGRAMTEGGVIVNLASTAAFKTNRGTSAYIASKSAVVGLTRSLALELGERGIRVLGVAPTVIETPGVTESTAALARSGIDVSARLAANPLGRAGTADDIARVVFFCCSPLAGFMTGTTLPVDAGSLL